VSASIREIVDAALTVVGEVTGPGVQLYGEDGMKQDAVRAFNMMFKKYPWQQYLKWFTITLDGVSGLVDGAGPFEQVKDFEDFIAVHMDKDPCRLPIASTRVNPSTLIYAGTSTTPSTPTGPTPPPPGGIPTTPGTGTTYTGGGVRVQCWTSLNASDSAYAKKKLQFYPLTAKGPVNVLAKVYPLIPPAIDFDWDQIFYLDKDMLVYATAFMTLSGDDLNASAADVARNLMEMKYKDVMHALASHGIPVEGYSGIPMQWSER
jgi:hypothetical protein